MVHMRFNLNQKIKSNFQGYSDFIELYHAIKASSDKEIEINFSGTNWFEANLSAVLGGIIELLTVEGKKVTIKDVFNANVKDILQRNSFLTDFGGNQIDQRKESIITYKKFYPNADIDFIQYIKDELLTRPDFPRHSRKLEKKINENIFELYENARTHGQCRQIHTCGQYYPSRKRLDITIVDMGRTIKKNVNEYLDKTCTGSETIVWAIQYGNTTKTGNISGGLGLSIIMEFIQRNKGKIQIVSSDGFWEYRKGMMETKLFSHLFPGTIVTIEFNLEDKNSYQLKEEISLDDIF